MDKLLNLKISCLHQEFENQMIDIERLTTDTKQLAEKELGSLNENDYNFNRKEFINEIIRCIKVNFNTMTNCNKVVIHSIKIKLSIKNYSGMLKSITNLLNNTIKTIKRNSVLFICLLISLISSKKFLNHILYLKDRQALQNLIDLNNNAPWKSVK